jgi:hypothetical protein
MFDSSRNTVNPLGEYLLSDTSAAGVTSTLFDFYSNGFSLRAALAGLNANNGTYIYAAFAESPFKTARAR